MPSDADETETKVFQSKLLWKSLSKEMTAEVRELSGEIVSIQITLEVAKQVAANPLYLLEIREFQSKLLWKSLSKDPGKLCQPCSNPVSIQITLEVAKQAVHPHNYLQYSHLHHNQLRNFHQ